MLKSARKTEKDKDPEGRMPLVEHLRELRNRLGKAMLAIVVASVVGLVFYQEIINFLTRPVQEAVGCTRDFTELAKESRGACGNITMSGLMGPFTLMIKVSLTAGVVIASPVWLYQLWAFIAPGLHRHEKRYSMAFVAAGFPLFMVGAYFSYHVLPAAAEVLLDFTPDNAVNLLPLDELLDLVTRMVIVFGLSFELPLVLVMLNMTGMVTGKRMLGWWRAMIMGVTVFAAFATPTVDPVSMLSLAAPIIALYFVATGFSLLNDKRRRQREALGPDDDEASELDLTPEDVGEIESVSASRALPAQAQSERERINGYDDVT
ncbi:twin-arginine translocase subunit TatC [Streptomyces europaeiscabiei]|uniref:Sec-independent protein translocase protein TatC n=1 Tax=Streptomyces europaeiscabiei TaxID=146819 RepID=A0ABU4NNF1_9ACTN|nr:twin-arginine translocase subunit TatC [Streptomyces europaeiscabiei]MDX3546826.1 twin-arginine translocase subunit TatC [Streptomyces europaeiscabiei]MDX3556520.1 twin-arginine translocase subunit TatC [Streptomyces europaeiscabiei]MDX3704227.1 twin-arginine translocase subunit TatC [Streptomyces europaeiscabiei]MDX3711859.1 twin-arginine translocase subunit TatC [Streptomyces europaeiscabiei]